MNGIRQPVNMKTIHREETALFAIAALCGVLIAASNVGHVGNASPLTSYAYWLVRILIEAALFVAFRDIIEKFAPQGLSQIAITAIAILTSLFPFVLAITAFDIVLGFPELGLDNNAATTTTKLTEFGLELFYLLDNHVALCLLLSVPRALAIGGPVSRRSERDAAPEAAAPVSLLQDLTPPLAGVLLWAEAQEHYVRLTTTTETRMVLHRFVDVLRTIPAGEGMRVHRSHWVAFAAISEVVKEGPNLRLKLQTGDMAPVSRSYRKAVEAMLADRDDIPAVAAG